jgi:capsular polysaccharide biosynthesis protein
MQKAIARRVRAGAQMCGMQVRDIRDIAVHVAEGRAPPVTFREVAPAGQSAVLPPRFVLGPAVPQNLWDIFGQIETPAVGCYALRGARVAPTGIAVCEDVAFHSDAFLHPRHHVVAVIDRLNAEVLPVRDVPGPLAVVYGPAHETWGHWLTDFLPRLWVLREAGYELADIRFLVPADLRPFAWDLLRLCGVEAAQCVVYDHWREVIRTDLLLMPTGLRRLNRLAPCFAAATSFWTGLARERAGPAAAAAAAPRLYLSRDASPQGRKLQNRAVVAAVVAQVGLEPVCPERLAVAEQVALFSGASLIVGEYGSGLHNSVFAPPGAAVVALRGTSRHPDFVQTGIATALQQSLGYVFGITDGGEAEQSFSVDPMLLQRALRLMSLHVD